MKNFFKVFGFIALVAVIGFSMMSCENEAEKNEPKDALDGTKWQATYSLISTRSITHVTSTIEFNSPKFTKKLSNDSGVKELDGTYTGTYTISGSAVVLTYDNPPTGESQTIKGTLSGNKLTIDETYTKQ
jgi:uncharacterized lipoprotein YehR (DUF1307 family)